MSIYAVVKYKSGGTTEIRHMIASSYDYSERVDLTLKDKNGARKFYGFTESDTASLKKFIIKFISEQGKDNHIIMQNFSFVDGYVLTLSAISRYKEISFYMIDTKHGQEMTLNDVKNISKFIYFDYGEFALPANVSANDLHFIKNNRPYRVRDLGYAFGSSFALDYMYEGNRKTLELTYSDGCL